MRRIMGIDGSSITVIKGQKREEGGGGRDRERLQRWENEATIK